MNVMLDQQGKVCLISEFDLKSKLKEGFVFFKALGSIRWAYTQRVADGYFIDDYIHSQDLLLKKAQQEVIKREGIISMLNEIKHSAKNK